MFRHITKIFLAGLFLAGPAVFGAQDLLQQSWHELTIYLPSEYSRSAPIAVEESSINGRIAQTDNNDVKISKSFLRQLEASSQAEVLKKGVLLFVLGHEVAHRYLPEKHDAKIEMQADFFSAVVLQGMSLNYAAAPTQFFAFIKGNLAATDAHGGTDQRQTQLLANAKQIEELGSLFAELNEKLDQINAGTASAVIADLNKLEAKLQNSPISDLPIFKLGLAALRHKRWLSSASNKEIGVQFSVYIPFELGKARGSKGGKKVPGDDALFYTAKAAYEQYRKLLPDDAHARIGLLSLLVYDEPESRVAEFKELAKSPPGDAQSLNNLGATAAVLAREKLIPAETAIALLQKAQAANSARTDASDKYLQAKILFNLSRAYEYAGQIDKAASFMRDYRDHPRNDKCWKQEGFICRGAGSTYEKPQTLGGLKLGISRKEAEATVKQSYSRCKGEKPNTRSNRVTLLYSCGSGEATLRLVLSDETLIFVQLNGIGIIEPALLLERREGDQKTKVKVTLGQKQADILKSIELKETLELPRNAYEQIGLYLLYDDKDKLSGLGIGTENRMAW